MYDVIIIGAGVSGAAVARELSRYRVKACVLEKEEDVCCGTSKANSAIIHAGYDAEPGTLKAWLNVRGNEMMEKLSEELDFPFKRTGSLVICRDEEGMPALRRLYDKGIENGVPDLKILDREEVLKMEPNVADDVYAALYAPTAGIVCPFSLNIALAENAYMNGIDFKFDTEVQEIVRIEKGYEIRTDNGTFQTRYVVNAAGVYADKFHNMVSRKKIHITPRRGDYCLLDKNAGSHVGRTIFTLPTKYGKAGQSVRDLPMRQVITSFAGLRAHEDGGEFIIGESEDAQGFIDCAGIESPGLTSAPAIGKMAAGILREKLHLEEKEDFIAERKGILDPDTLTKEERAELIRREPAYGNIICRCEMVTEGEIIDAIRRPLGAKSLDGVKRRTRAGMGRCQSGFCSPRTMEILARELGISMADITKSGGASKLVVGINKDTL